MDLIKDGGFCSGHLMNRWCGTTLYQVCFTQQEILFYFVIGVRSKIENIFFCFIFSSDPKLIGMDTLGSEWRTGNRAKTGF
jgi:hypothetical protein